MYIDTYLHFPYTTCFIVYVLQNDIKQKYLWKISFSKYISIYYLVGHKRGKGIPLELKWHFDPSPTPSDGHGHIGGHQVGFFTNALWHALFFGMFVDMDK